MEFKILRLQFKNFQKQCPISFAHDDDSHSLWLGQALKTKIGYILIQLPRHPNSQGRKFDDIKTKKLQPGLLTLSGYSVQGEWKWERKQSEIEKQKGCIVGRSLDSCSAPSVSCKMQSHLEQTQSRDAICKNFEKTISKDFHCLSPCRRTSSIIHGDATGFKSHFCKPRRGRKHNTRLLKKITIRLQLDRTGLTVFE